MDRNPWPPAPLVYTEARPCTTFLHADPSTFKALVQRFTGQKAVMTPAQAAATNAGAAVQKSAFKPVHQLQHRWKLTIATPVPRVAGFVSPKALSPSLSDMPGMCITDKAADSPSPASDSTLKEERDDAEEEKTVKEGTFYLHLSPSLGRDGAGELKLLTLFPLTPSYSKIS